MENRKNAIIDALVIKAETLADAHLAISTQEIPKAFRYGLNVDVAPKPEKSSTTEGELTKKSSVNDFQVTANFFSKD